MRRFFIVFAGFLTAASWAAAQQHTGAQPPAQPMRHIATAQNEADRARLVEMIGRSTRIGHEGMLVSADGSGAPYSAEVVTEFSQTLGDGTRIQREERVQVYRDSQGRIRRETPALITILDPVAGASYSLNPKTMTVRKGVVSTAPLGMAEKRVLEQAIAAKEMELRATGTAASRGGGAVVSHSEGIRVEGPAADARKATTSHLTQEEPRAMIVTYSHAAINSESLGKQSIEGVLCDGTRTTQTVPVGAIGNDRPIQVVSEHWYSPELRLVVMSRRTDPRSGDDSVKLTNIRRGEPSPNLFTVPAGYTVEP